MGNWIERLSEPSRLILAWQAPDHFEDRFRWAVAIIERESEHFVLRYLDPESEFLALNQGRSFDSLLSLSYNGYPGLSVRRGTHKDGILDILMRRLPPRTRPDFEDFKTQFRISREVRPSDLALLGYTEAKLPSDGFSLVNELDPNTPECDLMLEVAGYRYYVGGLPLSLRVGESIELITEPDNPYDPLAVQVCLRGQKIGNINRLQAATFQRWLKERQITGTMERLNGAATKPRAFIFLRIRAATERAAA